MRRERQRVRIIDEQRGVTGGAFYPNAEDATEPVHSALEPKREGIFTPEARALEQRRQKLREFVEGMGAKAQGVSSVETLQNVKWLNVLALKRVKCLLDVLRWFLPLQSQVHLVIRSKDLSSLNLL